MEISLRAIKRVTLRNHERSDIREEYKVQDTVRIVRTRRRQWRDHEDRMESNIVAKWERSSTLATTRLAGRPPKRWGKSWTSVSQNLEQRMNRAE